MHRSFVFRIHAEEVVGCAVELLLVMAVAELAVLVVTVEALRAEGAAFGEEGSETIVTGVGRMPLPPNTIANAPQRIAATTPSETIPITA